MEFDIGLDMGAGDLQYVGIYIVVHLLRIATPLEY
jgi:hypothetical protein